MKQLIDTTGLAGRIITRDDGQYEESRTMWNRAVEKYPLVIVYCKTSDDVRKNVSWARKNQMPIRIRSGGHHYEGYSTGNDILVIDISEMNGIAIDESSKQVTIEGGVRNRELYEFLGVRGYPFPGGGCPTVGVVGFALGGGWGYSCRHLGLACDSITQIELVNHEGELIVSNEKEHPELFWALRGSGGGQFGVVVKMTFALPEKRNEATLIRVEYSGMKRQDHIRAFKLWQEIIGTLCSEVNFKLSFYHSKEKGMGMLLIGMCYGTAEKAHEILEPFIKLGYKMQVLVQPMTVLEVNRWVQDAHPDFEHYKSSGRFVDIKFNEEEMNQLLDCIEKLADGAVYTALSCYGMGGKIVEFSEDESAFYYRNSKYILGFQTVWEDNAFSASNREWFIKSFDRIKKLTTGSFVNFPAKELEDYRQAYYGNYNEKLVTIRKRYDPDCIFKFEQGI